MHSSSVKLRNGFTSSGDGAPHVHSQPKKRSLGAKCNKQGRKEVTSCDTSPQRDTAVIGFVLLRNIASKVFTCHSHMARMCRYLTGRPSTRRTVSGKVDTAVRFGRASFGRCNADMSLLSSPLV